jgi:hypothetical protein
MRCEWSLVVLDDGKRVKVGLLLVLGLDLLNEREQVRGVL